MLNLYNTLSRTSVIDLQILLFSQYCQYLLAFHQSLWVSCMINFDHPRKCRRSTHRWSTNNKLCFKTSSRKLDHQKWLMYNALRVVNIERQQLVPESLQVHNTSPEEPGWCTITRSLIRQVAQSPNLFEFISYPPSSRTPSSSSRCPTSCSLLGQ